MLSSQAALLPSGPNFMYAYRLPSECTTNQRYAQNLASLRK